MVERKTENLLEQAFRRAGFQDADFSFQGSLEAEVRRWLPSKRSSAEGKGRPEHLIRLNGDAADILVTECKGSKSAHASRPGLAEDSPLQASKYAEDGVLHYMKGLRKEFNVIGLAVSGTETPEALQITTFKALRGGKIERLVPTKILKRSDYQRLLRESEGYGKKEESEIVTFARDLHDYLRDHMELSEAYKPLIVSGILLGLKDNAFERSYRDIAEKDDLAEALHEAIKRSLKKAKVKNSKFEAMMANYSFITTEAHPPHHRAGKGPELKPRRETWFGYWRDDGFLAKKNKRVERRPGIWAQIKKEWLDAFFNQRVVAGKSCKVAVSYSDEWVAEAYLEPDYSQLTREAYELEVQRHVMFKFALDTQVGFEVIDEDD